jgi:hypothetical protein
VPILQSSLHFAISTVFNGPPGILNQIEICHRDLRALTDNWGDFWILSKRSDDIHRGNQFKIQLESSESHRHPEMALNCGSRRYLWDSKEQNLYNLGVYSKRYIVTNCKFVQKSGVELLVVPEGDMWHVTWDGSRPFTISAVWLFCQFLLPMRKSVQNYTFMNIRDTLYNRDRNIIHRCTFVAKVSAKRIHLMSSQTPPFQFSDGCAHWLFWRTKQN